MRDRIALALYALALKLSPRFRDAHNQVIQQAANQLAAQAIAHAQAPFGRTTEQNANALAAWHAAEAHRQQVARIARNQ